MAVFDDIINAALEAEFRNPWIDDDSRSYIESTFGTDVLRAIIEMIEFAESHDGIWKHNSDLANSVAKVMILVQRAYPQLSSKAVHQIVNIAAYSWK